VITPSLQLPLTAVSVENIVPYFCHVLTKRFSCLSVVQIFVKGNCMPHTVIGLVGDTKVSRRGIGREGKEPGQAVAQSPPTG
jgi:hypothetical protein